MTPISGIGRFLLALPRGVAEAVFVVPGMLISVLATSLAIGGPDTPVFGQAMTIAIVVPLVAGVPSAIILMALLRALDAARREANRLAGVDTLTGVANRRRWASQVERELARAAYDARPAAIAVLDVDHFKQVNDSLGHAAGDAVLAGVADLLARTLRPEDAVGRWGGEEFVAFLPGSSGTDAAVVAERIRAAVAGSQVTAGAPTPVTVSVGVADAAQGDYDLDTVLAMADAAMYRAKRAGRNRVVVARRTDAEKHRAAHRPGPPAAIGV